jgi:hypothetical protein
MDRYKMNRPNLLITGGCSYSEVPNSDVSWPLHLQELQCIRYVAHTAHGAGGNDIISRKIISKVLEAIELGHKTEDMLVGVIWSGCDRMSHYSEELEKNYHNFTQIGMGNPANVSDFIADLVNPQLPIIDLENLPVKQDGGRHDPGLGHPWQHHSNPFGIRSYNKPSYYLMNAHWNDKMTSHYFERFVNPRKALIETCEHILRTQWFLKSKGINYFFSEYENDVFKYLGPHNYGANKAEYPGQFWAPDDPNYKLYSVDSECIQYPDEYTREDATICETHPEINYLYSDIDREYFLPITNLGDWVRDVSAYEYARPDDPHPSTEQHKEFTEKVILPFILEKYNIY